MPLIVLVHEAEEKEAMTVPYGMPVSGLYTWVVHCSFTFQNFFSTLPATQSTMVKNENGLPDRL